MRRFFLFAVISVLFIAIIVASTGILIDGRFKQLDESIEIASFSLRATPTFNIAARLQLLQNRLDGTEPPLRNLDLEARLQALASGISLYDDPEKDNERRSSGLSGMYERIGNLMGRRSSGPIVDGEFLSILDEAYFWERNRHYDQAIELYEPLLHTSVISHELRDIVDLHIAFCMIMIGDYQEAEERCQFLFNISIDPEVKDSAGRILNFIKEIDDRRNSIGGDDFDELESGRENYLTVNYSQAIEDLENFLKNNSGHPQQSQARYYKGRSHEELGQTGIAIEEYRRILILGGEGNWSRDAQRRLIMLNNFYDLEPIEEILLTEIQMKSTDMDILKIVETFSPLFQEIAVRENSTSELKIEENGADTGELFVRTNPPGALIRIDGEIAGTSPLFIPGVPFGVAEIEARFEGSAEVIEVIVDTQSIFVLDFDLMPKQGSLEIKTEWTKCQVYLDDREVWPIDKKLSGISPGNYGLTIIGVSSEGRPVFWEGVVVIYAGKRIVVEIP